MYGITKPRQIADLGVKILPTFQSTAMVVKVSPGRFPGYIIPVTQHRRQLPPPGLHNAPSLHLSLHCPGTTRLRLTLHLSRFHTLQISHCANFRICRPSPDPTRAEAINNILQIVFGPAC